jgi:hypothetical protein
LCFAEFVDHAVDASLALAAVVANNVHSRTVARRDGAGLF